MGLGMACLLVEWVAFLEVLEYFGTLSVLLAVVSYFSESKYRIRRKHYQAWQVINSAQGKGGSGGRIDAPEELHADGVPMVGVGQRRISSKALILAEQTCSGSIFARLTRGVGISMVPRCSI